MLEPCAFFEDMDALLNPAAHASSPGKPKEAVSLPRLQGSGLGAEGRIGLLVEEGAAGESDEEESSLEFIRKPEIRGAPVLFQNLSGKSCASVSGLKMEDGKGLLWSCGKSSPAVTGPGGCRRSHLPLVTGTGHGMDRLSGVSGPRAAALSGLSGWSAAWLAYWGLWGEINGVRGIRVCHCLRIGIKQSIVLGGEKPKIHR